MLRSYMTNISGELSINDQYLLELKPLQISKRNTSSEREICFVEFQGSF